jgi:UDP-N-acetylglucosamine:LPS N-acetylglucosamine transferase
MSEQLDAVFVLRGRPGLGHVSPGLAIARELAGHGVRVGLASYGPGAAYLARVRDFSFSRREISVPDRYAQWAGLTVYDQGVGELSPWLERTSPRLLVLGGEYIVPPAVAEPGLHVSLLFNPEIMTEAQRNQRAAKLFSRLFSYCDSLVPLQPPPSEAQTLPAFRALRTKFLAAGAFAAARVCAPPSKEAALGRLFLIANGGGTAFPGVTSSYSDGADLAGVWLEQTRSFTEAATLAACQAARIADRIQVFSSLPVLANDALRLRFANDARVTITEVAPEYYAALAQASVIVSRAGLGFVNDLPLTRAGVVLWALEQHDEQALNAQAVVSSRPGSVYVKTTEELPAAIATVLEQTSSNLGDHGRLQQNLQRVVRAYLGILRTKSCC